MSGRKANNPALASDGFAPQKAFRGGRARIGIRQSWRRGQFWQQGGEIVGEHQRARIRGIGDAAGALIAGAQIACGIVSWPLVRMRVFLPTVPGAFGAMR